MRVRGANQPYFFSKSNFYKSLKIDSDTQMHLWSSTLTFFIDWDFALGHLSMDSCSVIAALSSHGVTSVTGTNIQAASPQGCTPGLAGPEPLAPSITRGSTYSRSPTKRPSLFWVKEWVTVNVAPMQVISAKDIKVRSEAG